MKIVIACLIGISMCLSCKTNDDSMKRRDEISKIMKNYHLSYGFNHGFEIEGPFTIEQFKEDYVKREVERLGKVEDKSGKLKEVLDRIKRFPDSQKFKDFVRPVENDEGNELYFFRSDLRSWKYLLGEEGYVIIDKNEVVYRMVTFMN